MIHIHSHIDDLDIKILASLTDNPIQRKRDRLLDQNLPAILRREDRMIGRKCYRVSIMAEFSAPHTH